jgi:hypothetical protein
MFSYLTGKIITQGFWNLATLILKYLKLFFLNLKSNFAAFSCGVNVVHSATGNTLRPDWLSWNSGVMMRQRR